MDTDVKGHLLIAGRVQGVGYRYFTQVVATQLGLRGYVRNRRDGTVEVMVEGPRRVIDRFMEELRRGPYLAVVKNVEVTWGETTGTFSGFTIRS